MQIDTTINIKLDFLSKLAEISDAYAISINKIIALLLHKLMRNVLIKAKLFNTVKYQKTGDDIVWHTLHVSFTGDIYEKALDLRKMLKMSVSYIIARTIELYLDQIIKELTQNNTDNNSQDYVFITCKCNGLLSFSVFWSNLSGKILKKYKKIHPDSSFIKLNN